MKKVQIRKLHIENFKGIANLDIEFDDAITRISGRNASGKTTIADAVSWLLFNKTLAGKIPDKIRPHDANGNDIDSIDIIVAAEIVIDGIFMTVKKKQSQKWTKPRGSETAVFGGNVNEYEINDVPLTEKNYIAKISENIIDPENFRYCCVLGAFLALDQKKRRELLLGLSNDISVADIMATEREFSPLAEVLQNRTIEEATAMLNKSIKGYENEIETVPVRIDELNRTKAFGDMMRLTEARDSIKNRIDGISDNGLPEKLSELQNMRSKAILEFETTRKKEEEIIRSKRAEIINAMSAKVKASRDIEFKIAEIESKRRVLEQEISVARQQYTVENSKEFTMDDVCPTCGQEIPKEKIEAARTQFETERDAKIANIKQNGDTLNANLKQLARELKAAQKELNSVKKEISAMKETEATESNNLEAVLRKQADTHEIDTQISEVQNALKAEDFTIKHELTAELVAIEKQIALVESNKAIDDRITALKEERTRIVKLNENAKRTKYLLEKLNRRRTELLTASVNEYFKIVKWELFEEQINGGFKEICNATINGSAVGNGLNTGHSMLANLDICQTMQTLNDISIFTFIDNAECLSGTSLQAFNNSALDNQKIYMQVSDSELHISSGGFKCI